MSKRKEERGFLAQIPANEIEEYTSQFIKQKTEESFKFENHSIEIYEIYKINLENYIRGWNLHNLEIHHIIRQIIVKTVVSTESINYFFNERAIDEILEVIIKKKNIRDYESNQIPINECVRHEESCELRRVNQSKSLIIGANPINKNTSLIELLERARKTIRDRKHLKNT